MHKTIFTWFGNFTYIHGVAGISLLSGKNTKCDYNFFSLTKHGNTTHNKTLITKVRFYRANPPLHGLSLKKSPIKNHATLFRSGQVVKPDQTKLNSTKPNRVKVYPTPSCTTPRILIQWFGSSFSTSHC